MIWSSRGAPEKRNEQGKLCAICGLALDLVGSELDGTVASLRYAKLNTRLVHHRCHVEDQRRKGFTDSFKAAGVILVE